MPKVQLKGGKHYTRETSKDSDGNVVKTRVQHVDGDVFDAPQREIDAFPDKLVPIGKKEEPDGREFIVQARSGEPGKFDIVAPDGSLVTESEGLSESEALGVAKKLNRRRTG